MNWYELLSRRWHDLGLNSTNGGCDENAILAFESRNSIQMPTELRLYFRYVNGMSMRGGHDVDDDGFSFLPLAKVESVAAFSSRMRWEIGPGIGRETAFVFVDYLQWSCAYAFETKPQNSGAIYLLGYETPKCVASSMSDFATMYLSDSPFLYQPS